MKKLLMFVLISFFIMTSSAFAALKEFPGTRVKAEVPDGWTSMENKSGDVSAVIISNAEGSALVTITRAPVPAEGADSGIKILKKNPAVKNFKKLSDTRYSMDMDAEGTPVRQEISFQVMGKMMLTVGSTVAAKAPETAANTVALIANSVQEL